MASMSEEDQKRIETVSQFLLQSPPGEINDVLNGTVGCVFDTPRSRSVSDRIDVRVLIGDDESLETGVLPALVQYNLEQLTVAEVPGAGHNVGL
jgi:capping protein alpha